MLEPRHFTPDYREQATLRDGTTQVVLRLLTPADAPLLREGFAQLSPHSRFTRFLRDKAALSEAELRYLTEVDGESHFALGAVVRGADGREQGLGVARFVCLADASGAAEAAVTVVDAAQGQGLGRLLLTRLARAARERGVERFSCWVMPGNAPMEHLLSTLGPCEREDEGDALLYSIPLPPPPLAPPEPLWRMLALAAEGALVRLGLAEHLPGAPWWPGRTALLEARAGCASSAGEPHPAS